ncbi:MAG: PDZ domain-containing protein [Cyanobacteria bacterium SZAS TMP-1]|nr:PDZ domain-containing protein [Cyanobacteria bacterium SZAS TMP-1]
MKKLLVTLTALSTAITLSGPALAAPEKKKPRAEENLSFAPLEDESGIVGLNYTTGKNGYPVVSDIYKDSPAARAGLKAGDEILAIDGQDARYIGYLHLQPMLTGQAGTKVQLKVRSGDGSKGSERDCDIVRVKVESFKDPSLQKYEIARWQTSLSKRSGEQLSDHLIDLPFSMVNLEHNRPTLFEFTSKSTDSGVEDLLKKHSDGAYILGQCRVVRITEDNPTYAALTKYLAISGKYALIPVYQPWLVTVKRSDVLTALPDQGALNTIARNLVHNSIRVQVSHAVAQQKGEDDQKLHARAGMAHRLVMKRFCRQLPANEGIVGLGFAPGKSGYAEVTQVFAEGPAARAGLKAGDVINKVNGADTRYIGIERIQAELTGPLGQTVKVVYSPAGDAKKSKTALLKYTPVSKFHEDGLAQIHVSTYKRVLAANPEDTDEYDVPCFMLSLAKERPTIFEITSSSSGPSVDPLVQKLNNSNKYGTQDVQVIRIGPSSEYYNFARDYFHIKSNYACLPLYQRRHHKIIKAGEIVAQVPGEADLEMTFEKLFPKNKTGQDLQ